MKKVLWFSRHRMTAPQYAELAEKLGEFQLTQVSGSPANVFVPFEGTELEPAIDNSVDAQVVLMGAQPCLKDLVKGFDEVAVVLPVNMLQQLLPHAGNRLLTAVNIRTTENGAVIFTHSHWEVVSEVKIVTSRL